MKKCKNKPLGLIPYTGNKQKLLPELIDLFPDRAMYTRFVDCFCGGLSVSLNVDKPVLSNDIDSSLIDMYKVLGSLGSLEIVYKLIKDNNLDGNNKESYLSFRDNYNKNKDPLHLYVLILHSFSNLNRRNASGEFNVNFGYRTINNSTIKRFNHFTENHSGITFSSVGYQDLDILDGDFVYCDPPYLVTEAAYNKYWDESEEKNLHLFLDRLDKRGIMFGMSNVVVHNGKENRLLKEWMKKYRVENLDTQYLLGQHGTRYEPQKTQEVYIYNY